MIIGARIFYSKWPCHKSNSTGSELFVKTKDLTPISPISHSSRDFYIRSYYSLLPPSVPDMLAVRTGQLTARDSHPIKSTALSADPLTPNWVNIVFIRKLFCQLLDLLLTKIIIHVHYILVVNFLLPLTYRARISVSCPYP